MFILSFRVTRQKVIAVVIAIALVAALSVVGVKYYQNRESLPAAMPGGAQMEDMKKATVKTNEQRIEFIESFGWEVGEEPAEVMEVIIPKEFDEVYQQYNSIQKMQGCDLEAYAGKRCKRYSYDVTNYPGQSEKVRINIIVQNNKIIGGDVSSLNPDGFMHGFAKEA
jgi:hypothetical protein